MVFHHQITSYEYFNNLISFIYYSELIEKNQCLCLFATHYHELSSLASEYPVALNLKVTFSKEESQGTVRMLYRVEEGVCDERFGLQVARLVHFPPEVLQVCKLNFVISTFFFKLYILLTLL